MSTSAPTTRSRRSSVRSSFAEAEDNTYAEATSYTDKDTKMARIHLKIVVMMRNVREVVVAEPRS
jgi:hypothetical protein